MEEILYIINREMEKLEIIFKEVKYLGENKDLWKMIISYWEDCKYFYNKKDYVKTFELVNYIWGMLDVLANLNMLKIPKDLKKWFKIEQEKI